MQQVLISLGAFGAAEVRRHGQQWFSVLAHEAGADGVEVRGELLRDAASELPAIGRAARERSLALVYSSPEGLWQADGALDAAALDRALQAARHLCAPRLKMSIGGFGRESSGSFTALAHALRASGIELVIENDQTVAAGTLAPLQSFFAQAAANELPLGMTFDMGNWYWTGECPLEAARTAWPSAAKLPDDSRPKPPIDILSRGAPSCLAACNARSRAAVSSAPSACHKPSGLE